VGPDGDNKKSLRPEWPAKRAGGGNTWRENKIQDCDEGGGYKEAGDGAPGKENRGGEEKNGLGGNGRHKKRKDGGEAENQGGLF